MIRATEAIKIGRSLLGTPYSELDCINFIKKIIREAEGGDKKYQTAGTDTLWNSFTLKGKYHDLTWREASIATPRAGMLAFKGNATDEKGDGEPHHVGLVTEKGTVLHSSSAKGKVVETPLTAKEGWTLLAQHKLIEVIWGASEVEDEPVTIIRRNGEELETVGNHIFDARVVNVNDDSWLNLREQPSVTSKRVTKIPAGATVEVDNETNEKWWQVSYNGLTGFCYKQYLEKIEPEETGTLCMVIVDDEGNQFIPVGSFHVELRYLED